MMKIKDIYILNGIHYVQTNKGTFRRLDNESHVWYNMRTVKPAIWWRQQWLHRQVIAWYMKKELAL